MIVKRITTNIATSDVSKARRFYADILGLEVAMDLGWIITFASPAQMAPQLSVATEGGSGTPVPDISIEVDDLDEVEGRVRSEGLVIKVWSDDRALGRPPLLCQGPAGQARQHTDARMRRRLFLAPLRHADQL